MPRLKRGGAMNCTAKQTDRVSVLKKKAHYNNKAKEGGAVNCTAKQTDQVSVLEKHIIMPRLYRGGAEDCAAK